MTRLLSYPSIYFLMDKTNKITITCLDWDTRVDVSQAVADLLHINMLDLDDYIIRGSVLNGDLDEFSKEKFIEKYGQGVFDTLEGIAYLAYVETVDAPFVISIGNDRNKANTNLFGKTISVNVRLDDTRSLSSTIADYSVKKSKSVKTTAKQIAKIITSDERWSRDL